MHDPRVPVNTDAGQKQNTSIEIHVEDETLQSTQHIPKYPVCFVEVVKDEERQREDIAEISQGQVKHVDRDAAPGSHVEHKHPYGQAVAHQPGDEYHDVNRGQVVELKASLCEGTSSALVV